MPVWTHVSPRRLSVIFLAVAFGMLVGGFTVLEQRLRGTAYVLYWLACFAAAGLAMVAALLDLLAIRRAARQAQRDLIEASFPGVSVKPPRPSARAGESPRQRNP